MVNLLEGQENMMPFNLITWPKTDSNFLKVSHKSLSSLPLLIKKKKINPKKKLKRNTICLKNKVVNPNPEFGTQFSLSLKIK